MEEQTKQNDEQPESNAQRVGEESLKKDNDKSCCGHGHGHNRRERCYRHHQAGGGMIWGAMLVLGGILLFLNNVGVVPWQVWHFIWPFWPVLLILIGVGIILGGHWVSEIILFLISLAVFGFIIIRALIGVGSPLLDYIPPSVVNFINQFKF